MPIPSVSPMQPATPALTGPISTVSLWKKRSFHPSSTFSTTGSAWPWKCSVPPATPSQRSPSPAASTMPRLFPAVSTGSSMSPQGISERPCRMSMEKNFCKADIHSPLSFLFFVYCRVTYMSVHFFTLFCFCISIVFRNEVPDIFCIISTRHMWSVLDKVQSHILISVHCTLIDWTGSARINI